MTNNSTHYSSSYILNREYFGECFDESANTTTSVKTYLPAIFLISVAGLFFIMEIEPYAAWFLLCLGGVELLSIRYKRGWWIARQMLSRRAGSKINLRIDHQGIFTDSAHHQQEILWNNISDIKSTEKGFVVTHNTGTNYLSKSGLDERAINLIITKGK